MYPLQRRCLAFPSILIPRRCLHFLPSIEPTSLTFRTPFIDIPPEISHPIINPAHVAQLSLLYHSLANGYHISTYFLQLVVALPVGEI
jgi:hypothetical protein